MRKTTIIWILFVLTLPCACSQSGPDSNKSMPRTKSAEADFSIVNWNVQTFFDANTVVNIVIFRKRAAGIIRNIHKD